MGFDGSHPVASVAARLCRVGHGHRPSHGDVACAECWGAALIADKEAAAEAGLPEVCPADPDLVDEVAVERAVVGEPVTLTVAEWQVAKRAAAERHGVELGSVWALLAPHVTVVDALGNRLEAGALGIEVKRRRSQQVFAQSRWARGERRSVRRERFVAAAADLAAGAEAA